MAVLALFFYPPDIVGGDQNKPSQSDDRDYEQAELAVCFKKLVHFQSERMIGKANIFR